MSIAVRVRQYIRENFLFGKDDSLGEQDSLIDRGIIDSTGVMEVVTFIETEFAVTISDQDLVPENLDSISAITAFISRKLEKQSSAGTAGALAA